MPAAGLWDAAAVPGGQAWCWTAVWTVGPAEPSLAHLPVPLDDPAMYQECGSRLVHEVFH